MTVAECKSSEDTTLNLDPVVVYGEQDTFLPSLLKEEKWSYARVGEFEVLSSAPKHRVEWLLKRFQMQRKALEIVRPFNAPDYASATVILFGNSREFRRCLPEAIADDYGIVSYFSHDKENAFILIDMGTAYLQNLGIATRGIETRQRFEMKVEHDRQLIRQYARYLIPAEQYLKTPAWLLEGVSQMIMDMEVDKNRIRYGLIDNRKSCNVSLVPTQNLGSEDRVVDIATEFSRFKSDEIINYNPGYASDRYIVDRQFNVVLNHVKLMPLEEMLRVGKDNPLAMNSLANARWAKHAHAFVHLCRFGFRGQFREGFDVFCRRLLEEPLTEELFIECFGMDFKEMDRKVAGHVRKPVGKFDRYKLSEGSEIKAEEIEFRDAELSECSRILAHAMGAVGRNVDAVEMLRLVESTASVDPEFLATLGVAEFKVGRLDRAEKFLMQSALQGTKSPMAWLTLAKIRMLRLKSDRDLTTMIQDRVGRGAESERMGEILAFLLKARSLKPALPETYQLFAETLELFSGKPTLELIEILHEGALKFPEVEELAIKTAEWYDRLGLPNRATQLRSRMSFR